MIDVGMSQNDGIDLGGIDWEGFPVSTAERSISLELTTVDQDLRLIRSNVKARSCDRAGGSPKSDVHGHSQPTWHWFHWAQRVRPRLLLCATMGM